MTWTQATRFNLDSYFGVLAGAISPQTGRPYSTETRNRRRVAIEAFYKWAREAKLASVDTPEDGLLRVAGERGKRLKKRTAENAPVSVLQPRQVNALFKELGVEPEYWSSDKSELSSRDWMAADIAFKAGLRISEVTALRVSQFSSLFKGNINPLKRYPVQITGKGGVTRSAKFPGELIVDLKAYVDGERAFIETLSGELASDYLLLNPLSVSRFRGKPVSTRTIERAFASACVRSGLYINETTQRISWGRDGLVRADTLSETPLFVFHDLRHTYAVWSYYKQKENGISEPWLDIQACLGHADLRTTLRIYLRCTQDFEAKVTDAFMRDVNAI